MRSRNVQVPSRVNRFAGNIDPGVVIKVWFKQLKQSAMPATQIEHSWLIEVESKITNYHCIMSDLLNLVEAGRVGPGEGGAELVALGFKLRDAPVTGRVEINRHD